MTMNAYKRGSENSTEAQQDRDPFCQHENPQIKLMILAESFAQAKDHHEWRSTVDAPILKTLSMTALQSSNQYIHLKIVYESVQMTLADIGSITVTELIYLLKETLSGYSTLSTRFGLFGLTPKMVTITGVSCCKIWLSSRYWEHEVQIPRPQSYREIDALLDILTLFRGKIGDSEIASRVFTAIEQQKTIKLGIKALEDLVLSMGFVFPSKFRPRLGSPLKLKAIARSLMDQKQTSPLLKAKKMSAITRSDNNYRSDSNQWFSLKTISHLKTSIEKTDATREDKTLKISANSESSVSPGSSSATNIPFTGFKNSLKQFLNTQSLHKSQVDGGEPTAINYGCTTKEVPVLGKMGRQIRQSLLQEDYNNL